MSKKVLIASTIALGILFMLSATTTVYLARKSIKQEKTIASLEEKVEELEEELEPEPESDFQSAQKQEDSANDDAVDENAIKLDEEGEKLEASEGGGAVSTVYKKEITCDLSKKEVSLYFKNPFESTHSVKLEIVINDTVVAQSGLIPPGYELKTLSLIDNSAQAEGEYSGKIVVFYYDAITGEPTIMKAFIPLTITVQK